MSGEEVMVDSGSSALPAPMQVVYCGKCGMPPEYCEYGPDFESHCDPWLKKHHPDLHARLKMLRTTSTKKAEEDGNGGDDEEPQVDRPSAPWTIEQRLTAFYEKYQPDKVADVPGLLDKYAGKEDKLFLALVKKYGPEPDDPYYAGDDSDYSGSDDDDEGELEEGMDKLSVKKRRGVKAKKSQAVETRVIIQKMTVKRKKATTIIVGLDTVPGLKLKDASKAFSKAFAGSSSVKDTAKGGKEIIIQGDHMEDVAEMIVSKFGVSGKNVFLDLDGKFEPYA